MQETIGMRIQKYRKEKGMTQEELAEKLGVSPQAVSKWENDASCPDVGLLPRLCHVLDITADELLIGKSNEVRLATPEERKPLEQLVMHIRINSADGDRVRVNLPMPLVQMGLAMGLVSFPNAGEGTNRILRDVDIERIVAMAEKGLIGKLVEVESNDGDTVEIVVE